MKFHHKKKNYPGRWIVKTFEMMLLAGIVLFGLTALGALLAPEPDATMSVSPQTLEYNMSQNDDQTFTYRPSQNVDYDAAYYFAQGLRHHQTNDYYEAIASYTRTLTTNDGYSPAYLNRAVAYESLGEVRRAKYDFAEWLRRDSAMTLQMGHLTEDSESHRVYMAEGKVYAYTFYANPGEVLNIRASSDRDGVVDPLLVVVDSYGNPVVADDDIRRDSGSLISMDSFIQDWDVPYMGCSTGRTLTLLVSHAGGGSYGNVTIDFERE